MGKGKTYDLTDRLCRELPAPEKGNRIYYDSRINGLGLRVTAAGSRAFVLVYSINGDQRRMTIGDLGDPWSVSNARAEAKDLKRRIDRGDDPLGAREKAAAEPTVKDLVTDFIEWHVSRKRPATREAYERHLYEV